MHDEALGKSSVQPTSPLSRPTLPPCNCNHDVHVKKPLPALLIQLFTLSHSAGVWHHPAGGQEQRAAAVGVQGVISLVEGRRKRCTLPQGAASGAHPTVDAGAAGLDWAR
eukprot:351369-Chlamydomonas_euryale.AAC.5